MQRDAPALLTVLRLLYYERLMADRRRLSAADHGHGAVGAAEALVADVVLQLFLPRRRADDLLQLLVGSAAAQRAAQIGLDRGEEARAEGALGGEANAIALGAERLADRGDEANRARHAVGEAIDARGGAGIA